MVSRSISRYLFSLFLFLLPLVFLTGGCALAPEQFSSFEFQRFDEASNFESQISLFGDAKADGNGAFLQITESWNLSAGRVMYRKPFTLAEGENPRGKFSFGTCFSFSISPEAGDGLAFVMVPDGLAAKGYEDDGSSFGLSYELAERRIGAFAVEFDTKVDPNYGDPNANHVGVDVGSLVSAKISNASKAKLVLNSGEKLQCWIDYEASSKRVEVRLSRFGHERPIDPLLSCPIDLSQMFKNREVYFGLTSSNANSTQITKLYSWSFKLRPVPYWMHSQPLDPESFAKDTQPVVRTMHKKSDCVLRVLTALIVGTGCGALGAFVVLLVWTMITNRRRPIVPEEFVEYDSDKVMVLVVDQSPPEEDQCKKK